MPMRTLPSRQAGACGSGTGSGRYSSLLSKRRIEVSEAVIFQLRSLHSIESYQQPQMLPHEGTGRFMQAEGRRQTNVTTFLWIAPNLGVTSLWLVPNV